MNKAQLIANVARDVTISKASAERTINAFLAEIKRGVKKEKAVQIVGFGTFRIKDRKARMVRNPRTGARMRIRATRTVGFKAGRPFKAAL